MVKKLFKHEFKAWLRVMPIIWGIVIAAAGLHRIVRLFEVGSTYYNVISGSALVMYAVALIVCIAAPVVFGVVRFYRNMFTGEGYLTLTLPVTTESHLWVKTLTATAFTVASVLVAILSVPVITMGELFAEICKAGAYIVRIIPAEYKGHFIGYCFEIPLLLLVAIFGAHTYYDTCICIGQCAKKNRVLAAIGVYFGVYVATQILSTILLIIIIVMENAGMLESLIEYIEDNLEEFLHIVFGVGTVVTAALSAGCWLISRFVLRKKLNLE